MSDGKPTGLESADPSSAVDAAVSDGRPTQFSYRGQAPTGEVPRLEGSEDGQAREEGGGQAQEGLGRGEGVHGEDPEAAEEVTDADYLRSLPTAGLD